MVLLAENDVNIQVLELNSLLSVYNYMGLIVTPTAPGSILFLRFGFDSINQSRWIE